MPAGDIGAHLDGCAGCRAWQPSAQEVALAVRSEAPDAAPDLTAPVLAAVTADRRSRGTASGQGAGDAARGRRQVVRAALAVTAAAQLLAALPLLLGGGEGAHLSREMASFDVALAVGVLLAAWRPERARVFLPVAVALSVCLALTSTLDVAAGSAAVAHEVGHLVAVLQAGLLWVLGRGGSASSVTPGVRARAVA